MTIRNLLTQLSITICVIIVLNLMVARLARNSVPRQLLGRAERAEQATVVFLGNSTIAAGLDEESFAVARPGVRPLNLGLGSTSPVEHYLIYRQQNRHRSAAVIYGFFDTQLTDLSDGAWNTLIGNRAMSYYVEPEIAAKIYFPTDFVRRASFLTAAHIPVIVERACAMGKGRAIAPLNGGIWHAEKRLEQIWPR